MAGNNNRDKKGDELLRQLGNLTAKVKKYRSSEKKLAKRQKHLQQDHLGLARHLRTLERQSASLREGLDVLRRDAKGGGGGVPTAHDAALVERLDQLEQRLRGESAAREQLSAVAQRLDQQGSGQAELVQLLEQRLAGLASEMQRLPAEGTSAEAVLRPEVDTELGQLNSLAESHGRVIQGLGSRVEGLEQAVSELEERSRRIGAAVGELEGRSELLEHRLEQDIAAEGQALSATQQGFESQARTTGELIRNLESSQSSLSEDLRGLAGRQDGFDSDLAEAGNQIRYLSGLLDQLSASLEGAGEGPDRESREALLAKLESGYAGIQQQLDSHSALTEMLARRLELLSQAKVRQQPESAGRHPEWERLAEELRELQRKLAAVEGRAEGLERRVDGISRTSADTKTLSASEMDQLRLDVATLQRRLEGFDTLEQDLRSGFAELRSSSRGIVESGGRQKEALARVDAALTKVQSEFEASQTWKRSAEDQLGELADGYSQCVRVNAVQGERLDSLETETGKLRDAMRKTARFSQGVQRQLERFKEPNERLQQDVGSIAGGVQRVRADSRQLAARQNRWFGGVLALLLLLLLGGGAGAWAWWQHGQPEQAALRTRVAALNQALQKQGSELGDLRASAQPLEVGRIERTERSLERLQEEVVVAAEEANDNRIGIASLAQSQAAVAETVQRPESDLQGLAAVVEAIGERQGRSPTPSQPRLDEQTSKEDEREATIRAESAIGLSVADPAQGVFGVAWLRERDPKRYTIQLAGAYTEGVVETIAQRHRLPSPLASYRRERDGRAWYVLLFGDFATKAEALDALDRLPEAVKVSGPFLRRYHSVQRELP